MAAALKFKEYTVADSPGVPENAIEYTKFLLNVCSSTVIGIVNIPFAVTILDVTFIVKLEFVVPLLFFTTLIPVGIPVILPIEVGTCVESL